MADSSHEYLSDLGVDPNCSFPEPVVDIDPELRARTLLLALTISFALVGFGAWLLWGAM